MKLSGFHLLFYIQHCRFRLEVVSNYLQEPSLFEFVIYVYSGPIASNPMDTSDSSALENYPAAMGEISKEFAPVAHEGDSEKSRRPSSAKKVGFEVRFEELKVQEYVIL